MHVSLSWLSNLLSRRAATGWIKASCGVLGKPFVSLASPCLALLRPASPCLASPRLALPRLALSCLALPRFAMFRAGLLCLVFCLPPGIFLHDLISNTYQAYYFLTLSYHVIYLALPYLALVDTTLPHHLPWVSGPYLTLPYPNPTLTLP